MKRLLLIIATLLLSAPATAEAQIIFTRTGAAPSTAVFAPSFTHPGYLNLATYLEVDMMNPVSDDALNRGLISWWKVLPQTKGGSTFYDLMGLNDGTLTGMDPATDWVASPRGYVLDFDGDDDVAITLTEPAGDYTISAWVKVRSYPAGSNYIWSGQTFKAGLSVTSSGFPRFRRDFLTLDAEATGSSAIATDRFVHILGTLVGTTANVYVDGVLQDSDTGTGSRDAAWNATQRIGERSDNGQGWDGQIDDIRIVERALSASEVRALYRAGLRGHPQTINYIGQ